MSVRAELTTAPLCAHIDRLQGGKRVNWDRSADPSLTTVESLPRRDVGDASLHVLDAAARSQRSARPKRTMPSRTTSSGCAA